MSLDCADHKRQHSEYPMPTQTFKDTKKRTVKRMRVDIAIERGSNLHERVKEYSQENGLRMDFAYAELVEQGLNADE